ncbi:MAG: SUMF1/EgtB/PvdO family nonheme iron enzyme [Magnetococcales bacterium]|nr:SUMF1/EgtB/PvdO family nonheme iron enzyme [Magnetococcales bacterium]
MGLVLTARTRNAASTRPGELGNGRYRLLEEIGSGNFARVFRAHCVDAPGAWAVKQAGDEVGKRVLRWEAENLERLHGCIGVLPMREFWSEPDGSLCLVTEYLDAGDLKRYVRASGALAEHEALTILERVVQAVAQAHQLHPPLIHRDIKPDNILGRTTAGGGIEWFLADWGLAESWRGHHAPRFSGTARYTAPEVWKKRRYLVSDVYSLGMTLYFMLFGQPAYNGDSARVARGQCAPEAVVIPVGSPDPLKRLLAGMLVKNPAQRWSLEQVQAGLRSRLAQLATEPDPGSNSALWIARYRGFAMDFVWIPPGSFWMGMMEAESDHPDRVLHPFDVRCTPRHLVALDGFWMARYPVTRGQFRFFLRDSGYRTSADQSGSARCYVAERAAFEPSPCGNWERPGFVQTDDHPVVNVSHVDAKAFAEWLSWRCHRLVRLPTEAEWERACRAGGETRYHWGDEASPEQAHYAGGRAGTVAVGSYPPNGFGVYDLHGQVHEWVRDWYVPGYAPDTRRHNPYGADATSGERVLRGGSWHSSAWRIRSASRDRYHPEGADGDVGFRLAALAYPWEGRWVT